MKLPLSLACLALVGCGSMVRVVDKSEQQVSLSYLPGHHVEAAIEAQQSCSKYGRQAAFAWETPVDDRIVGTWNCEK